MAKTFQTFILEATKAKKTTAKKPKKAKYQYHQGKRKPASWLYDQECPHCNTYYEVHTHTKNENRCPECGENVNDENHRRCDCPHKEQMDEGLSNPMPSSYELRDLHLKNAAYYHKLADKHEKKTKKANSYHRDTAKYHEDEAKKLDRKR